jgi:hypothetical protein
MQGAGSSDSRISGRIRHSMAGEHSTAQQSGWSQPTSEAHDPHLQDVHSGGMLIVDGDVEAPEERVHRRERKAAHAPATTGTTTACCCCHRRRAQLVTTTATCCCCTTPGLLLLQGRVGCRAEAVARVEQLSAVPLAGAVHAVRRQYTHVAVQRANQQDLCSSVCGRRVCGVFVRRGGGG